MFRLLLFDVPFALEDLVTESELKERTAFALLTNHQQGVTVNAKHLDQRFSQLKQTLKFWKVNPRKYCLIYNISIVVLLLV